MKPFNTAKIVSVIFIGLLLTCVTGFASQTEVIDPNLEAMLQSSTPDEEISVIVTLADKVDLKEFKNANKAFLRAMIIRALKNKADLTQVTVQTFLKAKGVKRIVTLWLINGVTVTAPVDVLHELARLPGIESIRLDNRLSVPEVLSAIPAVPEWNINVIRAPELWALGYTGSNVVIASMDTGVDINHPDLNIKWRGGPNSWFDPNGQHSTPYDAKGHGTQTMGVIVGGDDGGTAIGVAPGAKWITVKIFNDSGTATYSAIHQGFQWLLDPDGNADTNDAPDVVNNSWGLDSMNGCSTEFQPDIQTLKASGIAVTFSAGNYGPNRSTSVSPANNSGSFAAGATDYLNQIASFSSRGPSACDGNIYPEVVAPGVNIRTTDLTFGGVFPDSYVNVSGTSFAAPHVSGAVALLLDAFPDLTLSELESALKQSSTDLGIAGPDNDHGYGLVDVMKAYEFISNSVICTDSDGDGYFAESGCSTAQDCSDDDLTVYPNAPETKHDGIDQDCNGYDLTINILKALYINKRDTLSVEATSALGRNANLTLVGYGSMAWNKKTSKWALTISRVGGNPETVTVSGIEGSESAQTIVK